MKRYLKTDNNVPMAFYHFYIYVRVPLMIITTICDWGVNGVDSEFTLMLQLLELLTIACACVGLAMKRYWGYVINKVFLVAEFVMGLYYLFIGIYGLNLGYSDSASIVGNGLGLTIVNTLIFIYFEKRKYLFNDAPMYKINPSSEKDVDNSICQLRIDESVYGNTLNKKENTLRHTYLSILDRIEIKHVAILMLCLVVMGTVVITVAITQSSSPSAVTSQSASSSMATARYIGNSNSMKFHKKSCSHLPDKDNRIYYNTRKQAIEDGMTPCKICNP